MLSPFKAVRAFLLPHQPRTFQANYAHLWPSSHSLSFSIVLLPSSGRGFEMDIPNIIPSVVPSLTRGVAESKRQQRESIWPSADSDPKEILRQLLLSNSWPEIVTYDGPTCSCNSSDQEDASIDHGVGTCTLMSMYCARTILDLEKQVRAREYRSEGRSKDEEAASLLGDILAERTVQRIVSIGKHLKGTEKMGPSELLNVPIFQQAFESTNRIERLTSYDNVLGIVDQLSKDSTRRITAIVICQSSQSAVCVKMTILDEEVFVVFDPHPRMDHLNGPGFMLSTSRVTTASFLNCMLDTPAPNDVTGGDVFHSLPSQYFTAHLFHAKESYHRITAYQNEQTLRDSFLCAHEEGLSTSVLYVNLWNQHLPPEAGPSNNSSGSHVIDSISSSGSSNSSSSTSSPPRSPILPSLPTPRYTREPWGEDTFRLLEQMNPMNRYKPSSLFTRPFQTTFDCAICLETYPVYSSIRLTGCDHPFCKECLQGHVQSFLGNGRFPIECPVCLLDRGIPDPGNVTDTVLLRLQLPPDCMDKFQELQALQHSVRLDCPSCNESHLLPRKEYMQSKVLTCLSCRSKWCKACSKVISDPKGKHSCKGDGFDKLMKKKGWRHCPGCTMPVVKDSGCNHMSCSAPGCHTHFCYKCGKLIVVSATGRNVGEEVTIHYNNGCRQFERKLKCNIQ